MKGLAWVAGFVAIGVAAGATAYGLMPARYRAATTLQVTITRLVHHPALDWRSDRPIEPMLHDLFSETWTESLMQEFGLYPGERGAGRWADALLQFMEDVTFSRHVESEASERWTVTFEADDPSVSASVSYRLASFIADSENDDNRAIDEPNAFLLEVLDKQRVAIGAAIEKWRSTQGDKALPAAAMEQYEAISAHLKEVQRDTVDGPDRVVPFQFHFEIVKTPRVSDGRVSPQFCRSPVLARRLASWWG